MKDSYGCETFCEYCKKPLCTVKYEDGKKICNRCKNVYPDPKEVKKYG